VVTGAPASGRRTCTIHEDLEPGRACPSGWQAPCRVAPDRRRDRHP